MKQIPERTLDLLIGWIADLSNEPVKNKPSVTELAIDGGIHILHEQGYDTTQIMETYKQAKQYQREDGGER